MHCDCCHARSHEICCNKLTSLRLFRRLLLATKAIFLTISAELAGLLTNPGSSPSIELWDAMDSNWTNQISEVDTCSAEIS